MSKNPDLIDIDWKPVPRRYGVANELYRNGIQYAIDSLLGLSPNEIRDLLKAAGIKGDAHDPCKCPIAEYIKLVAGKRAWVESRRVLPIVGKDDLPNDVLELDNIHDVELPKNVWLFIVGVDTGEFPEVLKDE